jgi:hypothetical protein
MAIVVVSISVAEVYLITLARQSRRFWLAKASVGENSQMSAVADGARARLSALNDLTTFVHALFGVWRVA